MTTVSVPIEFLASFDAALKQLNGFASQANKKLDGVGSKLSLISLDAILDIGEKVFEVFEKVASGIGDAINVAAEAEDSINRLGIALKASGDYSQQNVDAFRALAEQLSQTTRFTDDQILSQVALAKQFNTTNQEAAKLISAATELAAATGEDLNQAVTQLGETMQGAVGRVGRLIPSLQQLSREQLLAGDAIDVVAKRFKGFSEGELQTFNGSLLQLGKAFKEIQKVIGEPIVENAGLREVIKAVTVGLVELKKGIIDNTGIMQKFVSFGVLFAVESINLLLQEVDLAIRIFQTLYGVVQSLSLPFLALTVPIRAISVGFTQATKEANDFANQANKNLQSLGSAGNGELHDMSKQLDKLADKIAQVSVTQGDFVDEIGEGTKAFDNQKNAVARFDTAIIEKVKSLKEELKNVGEDKIQTLTNQYNYQINLINQAAIHDQNIAAQSAALKQKLLLKYNNELFDAIQAKVQQVFQNPFSIINGDNKSPGGKLKLGAGTQENLAAGLGIGNNVLQGAAGATNLLASLGSSIATLFLGPLGQVFGPIIQQLAKGPDAVRKMVQDFAKALPDIIANIAKAAPAFTVELIKQIPAIINGIIDNLPDIIEAIIEEYPQVIAAIIGDIPKIIAAIVTKLPVALVNGIGKVFHDIGTSLVAQILSGAAQFVGRIISGAGQFISELIKQLSGGIGGKKGFLGTGFLNFSGGGFGLGGNQGLLGGGVISGVLQQTRRNPQVTERAQGPSTIEVPVKIGNSEFARAIINVKRLGYRLEPI